MTAINWSGFKFTLVTPLEETPKGKASVGDKLYKSINDQLSLLADPTFRKWSGSGSKRKEITPKAWWKQNAHSEYEVRVCYANANILPDGKVYKCFGEADIKTFLNYCLEQAAPGGVLRVAAEAAAASRAAARKSK
jgi:hypothetical protein